MVDCFEDILDSYYIIQCYAKPVFEEVIDCKKLIIRSMYFLPLWHLF